ncbi:MAG: hypothetical protein ASARMPREDX12_008336 [Alectoria sarmentosa]|nr:MAG: hypothetical protein ASARMPREDX12_008336 [Alectoria sarmentosa]
MDGPLKLRERRNVAQDLHEETLSALHLRGQDLYRQKQYEAALQFFTMAISQDAKAPVAVLDNRAATYTKLGNLQAALNDGRQMIQQDKANCLGYLRTGKILQLLANHKMALDLYEMGTRKVPSSDPNIMLLRGQHEKLARQLAPPRAIDPLQILPLELVEMTITYLEFRHTVWWLTQSLEIVAAITDLDAQPVEQFGSFRGQKACYFGSCSFGSNAEKIPRYVATRCKALEDLRIPGGLIGSSILEAAPCASNLKTLIISRSCQVSCDTASQLLRHCPNLERAEFHSVSSAESRPARWEVDMPKLRTLTLDTPIARRHGKPVLALDTLLIKISGINTLSVQGWFVPPTLTVQELDFSNLHQLQHLNISGLIATLPPQLPSALRTLSMTNCACFPRTQRVNFANFDLPQIIRLSLAGWSTLLLGDLQACLIQSKGRVTHLDIGGCIALSSANLKELITHGYLEGIEDLVLKSCNIDDEVAMLIAKNLHRLKNLNLACTKVTGVGVKALIIGLEGKLEHLCLDGCRSTNIDAVEFARAMGVKVAFGFPDPLSGGRRIKQH